VPCWTKLKSNGNWYHKRVYRVKQYKNCKNCPVKDLCTKAKYQRIIERHEFAEALENNKQNITKNPEIYAQRQSIVEHPFGTMKRQWGFDHIITKKSMKRASADVGFIFIAYNLRRIINLIGTDKLIKADTQFYSRWSTSTQKNIHKPLFCYLTYLNILTFLNSRCQTLLHFCYFYPKYKNSSLFLDRLPLAGI
jgi:hypothetical protein